MRERYVRRCNELRAEGKSDAYIAERLRQEGITGQNGVLPTWKSVYMFFYLKNKKEEKSVQQESKTLNNIENATQCSKIIREHNEKVLATTEPTVLEPLVKASNAPPLVRAILSATELSAEKRIAMLVAYFEPEAE